ncbi:Type-2 restriction enzyme SalI [Candidatus Terasakiella magnetica]|nr:Type-2 restriction enzyme SalI [Candidatus Terasakiella magnetica]
MPVNLDKPNRWKADIALSVDMYNDWFMNFAPKAFRDTRVKTTKAVESTLNSTDNIRNIRPEILRTYPGVLPTLRMSTCPPIAVDRLVGLAKVSKNLVGCMEEGKIPPRMSAAALDEDLRKIGAIIQRMADPDIFVWLERGDAPKDSEFHRAATIVADRLCGAVANPIVRNAQEKRQLAAIATWLEARGYIHAEDGTRFDGMTPGTFSFRMNVPVRTGGGYGELTIISPGDQNIQIGNGVNIPVDVVIQPISSNPGELPVFIEAKSAGDFTNVNKRRKEEAAKMSQLRNTYGAGVRFNLFLCGYFDSGYLGYEAAEGIDWCWEHRIDDLAEFGL